MAKKKNKTSATKKAATKKPAPKPVKQKEVKLPTEQKKEWVALFSESGSEIVELVKDLGYWPGTIITNNFLKTSWDKEIVKREEAVTDKKKKTVHTVNVTQAKTANFIHRYAQFDDSQVTLHDWNKKIPAEIKTGYTITKGKPIFDVEEEAPIAGHPEVVVQEVDTPTDIQNQMEAAEKRVNIIGKNGPTGEHYKEVKKVKVEPAPSPIGIAPKVAKQWIAMFSQSGSEIANLSKALGYWPTLIITNNSDKSKWDPRIVERVKFANKVMIVTHAQAKTANFIHNVGGSKDALITLHGWLRVIPAEICEQYKIVNGHPGLINQYPELKGIDPQERWWANRDKYNLWYGSVVHDVVPEVDAGQIHAVNKRQLTAYEELDCNPYDLFRQTSLNSWVKYFTKFPIR